jgi:hypothetical protein
MTEKKSAKKYYYTEGTKKNLVEILNHCVSVKKKRVQCVASYDFS